MQIVAISNPSQKRELDPTTDQDFSELVRLHHRELVVYAQSLTQDEATARDIVQDAFIIAYDKVRTFDVTRDFATWMRGIVRNKWREWLRKNKRYTLTDTQIAQIDSDIAAWQTARVEGSSDLFAALEDCLRRLPEGLREVIEVTYFEGCTSEEASAKLGLGPAAIRKRLQRARESLKQCLEHKSGPSVYPSHES
ncbi:MAG: RNA polymerase sigma factor [Verrucomicrobiales bacterium]|nr:RNA polymerase sigma factor [Verrucomicrobiales bacterium]